MWLINAHTFKLESFIDERQVPYAILSHRWQDEEVLFDDLDPRRGDRPPPVFKAGWKKIQLCCQQAQRDKLDFAWVDTCCINKESSAELQEAINSMFKWYAAAKVCYAYLSDVKGPVNQKEPFNFGDSEWFERGWTLQELLAPSKLIFYDRDWREIGDRTKTASLVHRITGIEVNILESGYGNFSDYNKPCVAVIMSWAKNRKTTRPEDRAYSLLGLFDVNMPMLYGEGEKAFIRLQEAILSRSDDQTIFAWEGVDTERMGLLAPSPDFFPDQGSFLRGRCWTTRRSPHNITNQGIQVEFDLVPLWPRIYLAILNAKGDSGDCIGIYVKRIDEHGLYARIGISCEKRLARDLKIGFGSPKRFRTITVVTQLRTFEMSTYFYRYEAPMHIRARDDEWTSWKPMNNFDFDFQVVGIRQSTTVPETSWMEIRPEIGYGLVGSFDLVRVSQGSGLPGFTLPDLCVSMFLGYDANFSPVCIVTTSSSKYRVTPPARDFLDFEHRPMRCYPNPDMSATVSDNVTVTLLRSDVLALRLDPLLAGRATDKVQARITMQCWVKGFLTLTFHRNYVHGPIDQQDTWRISFENCLSVREAGDASVES